MQEECSEPQCCLIWTWTGQTWTPLFVLIQGLINCFIILHLLIYITIPWIFLCLQELFATISYTRPRLCLAPATPRLTCCPRISSHVLTRMSRGLAPWVS
uniref:Uncharacterized protein n=1 Tax=Cacopsylla melanoneura TaxID=428564 RepID=A0A8D8YPH8_9HEMI